MHDGVSLFDKAFVPTAGGYLYYPSARSGGKLVTSEERDRMVAGWHRVIGPGRGYRHVIMMVVTVVLTAVLAERVFSLPRESAKLLIWAAGSGYVAWLWWVANAPRRLVSGRPDAAPPRSAETRRKFVDHLFDWRMIGFGLAMAALMLVDAGLRGVDGKNFWPTLLSGSMLCVLYSLLAIQKARDSR